MFSCCQGFTNLLGKKSPFQHSAFMDAEKNCTLGDKSKFSAAPYYIGEFVILVASILGKYISAKLGSR